MVSRRNFFAITLIMLVVVFMFLVPEVVKTRVNNYGQNEYEDSAATGFTSTSVCIVSEDDAIDSSRYVVYIGDEEDDATGNVVKQWAIYSKRRLQSFRSVKQFQPDRRNLPEAVLVDSAYLNMREDISVLAGYTDLGVNLIFCNLPDVTEVSKNPKLRQVLGINAVIRERIKVEGIRLMDGFLLGGIKEYILDETMEKTQQDMDLVMPWYRISGGAKMYMHGMMKDEEMEKYYMMPEGDLITKNQNLPAVVWRNKYRNAMAFAVNADYLSGNEGIGILSAMMLEMKDYDIYPVINAQNMVILNFPDLADENQAELMKRYSQPLEAVYRDIVWPGLVSVAQQNDYKMTCMLTPQMDYEDDVKPEENVLVYYMKRFQEQNIEAGFSGTHTEGTDLSKKLDQDMRFFKKVTPDYSILSFYQGNMKDEEVEDALKRDQLDQVRTVFADYEKSQPLVSYEWDSVLKQSGISDGYSHTFSENLRMMSIQTALGYSNIQIDVNPIAHPVDDEDSWEKLSRKFAGNTSTYCRRFRKFAKTTLAESNARIRRFLALDYQQERKGNVISMKISHFEKEAYFILRTHGEDIIQATGAEFEKIEDGAFLITATDDNVKLELEEAQDRYYYFAEDGF